VPADATVGVGRSTEEVTEERDLLELYERQLQINKNNMNMEVRK
jgi:hypothetical protein